MSFLSYKNLIPKSYSSSRRKYILRKLISLEKMRLNMRIQSGWCELDPAMFKDNRTHLITGLRHRFPNSLVLLKGNDSVTPHYCEQECFEQNSDFYWAFGVLEPDFWGAIDLVTEVSYLFYKCSVVKNKITPSNVDTAAIEKKYMVDRVMSTMEMKSELALIDRNVVLVTRWMDERAFSALVKDRVYIALADCRVWLCDRFLSSILRDCRIVKSDKEEILIRSAAKLNSDAIKFALYPLHCEITGCCVVALFNLYVKSCQKSASCARPPIVLSGKNALCVSSDQAKAFMRDTLKLGDLCVLDMGIAIHGYRTNIVLTVPVSGVFSRCQEVIYNAALAVRQAMLKNLKPGTKFSQLEAFAERTLVEQLKMSGMLNGDYELILKSGVHKLFCPNGIGHFLGIDFYDGETSQSSNSKRRTKGHIYREIMKPGMIIALNSELYINEVAIKSRLDTKGGEYLSLKHLEKCYGLVARVQDIVLLTAESYELLSSVPRSVYEITSFMKSKKQLMMNLMKISEKDEKLSPCKKVSRNSKSDPNRLTDDFEIMASAMGAHFGKDKVKSSVIVEEVIKKLTTLRNPPGNMITNELIEEVYNYPCKLDNLLPVVLVPLLEERRRPQLLPYPEVNTPKFSVTFPPDGFGCPYFGWIENVRTCEEYADYCADSSSESEVTMKIH